MSYPFSHFPQFKRKWLTYYKTVTHSNREGTLKKDENLYQEFIFIEQKAYREWVQLLGHDKGSHSGTTHLISVENLICSVLEKVEGVELSSVENFILLSAVLFHDLGKIVKKEKIDKFLECKSNHNIFTIAKEMQKNGGANEEKEIPHHALTSAMELLTGHDFGFRDKSIVECIAVICASHYKDVAEKLKNENELKNRFLDNYGKIRIGWLSALLTLGDELDNSYHRSAPGWAKSDEQTTKKDLRDKLAGCEIDFEGKVLLVHLQSEFYELLMDNEKTQDNSNNGNKKNDFEKVKNIIEWIYKDIKNKREILQFWHEEFRQMHINLFDAVLNIKGHLLGIKDKDKDKDKEKEKEKKKKKEKEKEKEKEKKFKSLQGCFQLVVEPIIRQMKLERVLDAALELRFNSFGKTTYPWETLATEAGIEDISEAKKIFHRLSMLASIFNAKTDSGLISIIKKASPGIVRDNLSIFCSFVELDGEWTINLCKNEVDDENDKNDSTFSELIKIIENFNSWVSKITSSEEMSPKKQHARKSIKIENSELAYLLDEKNDNDGIYFPACKSNLFPPDTHRAGINLVIAGPAGVGKSTLAMELLAKGKVHSDGSERLTINAYYSLEQQYSSLLEIAKGLRIQINTQIKNFNPTFNSSKIDNIRKPDYFDLYRASIENLEGSQHPVIYFPRLAPRSYGLKSNEEYLFWFRYKQIASLLEAARYYMLGRGGEENPALLNSIVIDNLNAFSRNPLARQQVHQLFKLISWSGQLGIYIIENNPSEEDKIFQSEVEFLADIVIRLDWVTEDYQYKTIEIAKSRCQRNVIGKHPFKIRRITGPDSNDDGSEIEKDNTPSIIYSEAEPGFEIYPSIHTQVSRSEKGQQNSNSKIDQSFVEFSKNIYLNKLVQKDEGEDKDTGINKDSFIMLLGKPGGHKLAIGMNYIHAKGKSESALIINLGQPIKYDAVADKSEWWGKGIKANSNTNLKWNKNQKVSIDRYCPGLGAREHKNSIVSEDSFGSVFVLNFHAGFLLPEEFLQIVKIFIEDIKEKGNEFITRVLFNSTAHLPGRFPLLDKNPLLLHALAKILKQKQIGFMIIGVEDMGQDEKLKGLISIADLKVTVHHSTDERLPQKFRKILAKRMIDSESNLRIISSDNVTGKDYSKKYKLFKVVTEKGESSFKISEITDSSS